MEVVRVDALQVEAGNEKGPCDIEAWEVIGFVQEYWPIAWMAWNYCRLYLEKSYVWVGPTEDDKV
jgi:hypothetical protein